MSALKKLAAVESASAKPAVEIRLLRFAIALILVLGTLWTLKHLLGEEILEKNKLEVGLLLGWLIAKSGTVIDWLFGGSESGGRRSDALAHAAAATAEASPLPAGPPDPDATPQPVNLAEVGGRPVADKDIKL